MKAEHHVQQHGSSLTQTQNQTRIEMMIGGVAWNYLVRAVADKVEFGCRRTDITAVNNMVTTIYLLEFLLGV